MCISNYLLYHSVPSDTASKSCDSHFKTSYTSKNKPLMKIRNIKTSRLASRSLSTSLLYAKFMCPKPFFGNLISDFVALSFGFGYLWPKRETNDKWNATHSKTFDKSHKLKNHKFWSQSVSSIFIGFGQLSTSSSAEWRWKENVLTVFSMRPRRGFHARPDLTEL